MTDVDGALYFTERVKLSLATFSFESIPNVTCSFGVTKYVPGDSRESITERADAALYLAKERGRDRAEVKLASSTHIAATAAPLPLKKATAARLRGIT